MDLDSFDDTNCEDTSGLEFGDFDERLHLLPAARPVNFAYSSAELQWPRCLLDRGDGVGLPARELFRVGDVVEDLVRGSRDVLLDREVDHEFLLPSTRFHQVANDCWRQSVDVSAPANTRAKNGPASRSSAAVESTSARM